MRCAGLGAVLGAVLLASLAPGASAQLGAVSTGYDEGYIAYGRGDFAAALRYWRSEAERGNAAAQHNLSLLYDRGDGVPQNFEEALKWTRAASEQGNHAAQLRLGMMFAEGRGVKRDPAEAAKWFLQSADQGNAQAQYNMGAVYEYGRGVRRDLVQSHMWYNLAAANFAIGWDRADAFVSRDRVAGLLTPAQLADAQKRAQDWKPTPQQAQPIRQAQ
ncbi:MAG: tetratricopeptide repeat protein [Rhodospirillales bacterium]